MHLDSGMPSLADAVSRVVTECAPSHVSALVRELRAKTKGGGETFSSGAGTSAFDSAIAPLLSAWRDQPGIEGPALAFAVEAAAKAREAATSVVELVWTGPATDSATTLNTTAVLFRIVRHARIRLLLMSFSAFPIPGLLDELQAACERGVSVRLVLESATESGGRLTVDAALPFERLRGLAEFYVWPRSLRSAGASMHAKVAVADGCTALVTSANLTERGVDSNLELGTYFEDERIPLQIERQVDMMIGRGVLVMTL